MSNVNVNYSLQDIGGNTALMIAIKNGKKCRNKIIDEMISKSVDCINYTDVTGKTALHHAVIYKHNIIKKLLDFGANKNIVDRTGKTALMYAMDKKNKEFISLLS